jgi:hypothetical protein
MQDSSPTIRERTPPWRKYALESGLNRAQLKVALKCAKDQKWIAETNKAAWSVVTQAGVDAANSE